MHAKKQTFFLVSLLFLTGCDLINHRKYHDPEMKLQKADYENMTKPPLIRKPIPSYQIQPKLCAPQLPPALCKKVSITLLETDSLKDILMELAKNAGVGIVLSPEIEKHKPGILYTVKDAPFIEVIRDICQLTQLRFQIRDARLLIEPDTPYHATYSLQFLSHARKSESRISVSTDVFFPIDAKSRTENGSDSTLVGNSQMDFWAELEANLKALLTLGNGQTKTSHHYTLHKQGGLVIVYGNSRQQELISSYLKKLKEAISTQVLIEAKIIEVTLSNEFKSGINWRQLGGDIHLLAPLGSFPQHQLAHGLRDVFTLAIEHKNFSSILNLVKKFGTVRTLSNPRLTVMNNQPAMLKVATNEVFFHLEFERYFQAEGKPDIESISSDAMTVPIGLVLVVQPSVNLESGEITMTLRPTLSRVQREVEDPAVAIKSHQKVKSTVPVVQVRELDSVLKIKSGQVLVMGGLMEEKAIHQNASVPGLDEIPFFGEFMRAKEDDRQVTELVIFLCAHIIEDPIIVEADERLYNTYTEDPRPLDFRKEP